MVINILLFVWFCNCENVHEVQMIRIEIPRSEGMSICGFDWNCVAILLSIKIIPIYTSTTHIWECLFPHTDQISLSLPVHKVKILPQCILMCTFYTSKDEHLCVSLKSSLYFLFPFFFFLWDRGHALLPRLDCNHRSLQPQTLGLKCWSCLSLLSMYFLFCWTVCSYPLLTSLLVCYSFLIDFLLLFMCW